MFPLPENHVAVAYSEVFELSLNREKPNLLLKAMKFHANKYQRIKLYMRKESVPFVDDLDVTLQLDDQDITEFNPAGGFQSMPVKYENGVNRQDGVHSLVFKVADTLDEAPMISSSVGGPKEGAAITTVIVLVFGNAEYDS